MSNTTLTAVQLAEHVKTFRTLGVKLRAQIKRNVPEVFIAPTLVAKEAITHALIKDDHLDLALALLDEQSAIERQRRAEAADLPEDLASALHSLRVARGRIKDELENVAADEALASLPVYVEPTALHMRRSFSKRVFRVLGIELGGVWLQALERTNDPIIRYVRELMEDEWIACEADGSLPTRDVHGTIFVPEDATLAELVDIRREHSVVSSSVVPVEEDDLAVSLRIVDLVDRELFERHQTGLRASLRDEANIVRTITLAKHHRRPVDGSVRDELRNLRIGINTHLTVFGHLVRD